MGERKDLLDKLSRAGSIESVGEEKIVDIGRFHCNEKIFSLVADKSRKIYEIHIDPVWPHAGIKGTWFASREVLDARCTREEVRNVVIRCERCQRMKSSRKGSEAEAQSFKKAE
jgi:hypothetical protein